MKTLLGAALTFLSKVSVAMAEAPFYSITATCIDGPSQSMS
jgi:hypothetical protein